MILPQWLQTKLHRSMLNFFRRIRNKLLSEGTFGKYAIYAIGEIILVVVGILIALQINNWNERQKAAALEQQLLTSLIREFETNLEILDLAIQTNVEIIEQCVGIGEFTGPSLPEQDEKTISEYMVGAFKNETRYLPTQGTINEANNSGKLSLISDDDLRASISAWILQLQLVARQEDYVNNLRNHTHTFFIDNGNFRRHLDMINDTLIEVKPSKFPANDFRFLQNQQFESNLYLLIVASRNLELNFYAPLRAQTEQLIEQLDQNIVGT